MKKYIALLLTVTVFVACLLTGCGGGDTLTLNVYNWGQYISEGDEGYAEAKANKSTRDLFGIRTRGQENKAPTAADGQGRYAPRSEAHAEGRQEGGSR